MCACDAKLLKLERIGSLSVVSLKNPSELRCIVLINKHLNVVSIVSLKNLGELNSIALIAMLVDLVRLREENR